MFRQSKAADLPKSLQKLSDSRRDVHGRFKSLKSILDHPSAAESKHILSEDPEVVVSLFAEHYNTIEQNLKQKGQKISRDDLDGLSNALEKILILIPDRIANLNPQPTVIGAFLKRCLNPKGALKLRRDSVRLFLLYYQIIRESATDDLDQLFTLLVTNLPGTTLEETTTDDFFEQYPPFLLPPSSEKPIENLARFMYENLIDLLVTQVYRIFWDNPEQYQLAFAFLFGRLKEVYFPKVFPHSKLLHPNRGEGDQFPQTLPVDPAILSLQVTTLKWVVMFFQSPETFRQEVGETNKKRPKESIGSTVSSLLHFDMSSSTSQDPKVKEHYSANVVVMVRRTFLSSVANMQLLHEMFETAFKFPSSEIVLIKSIVNVYKLWITTPEHSKAAVLVQSGTDYVDSGSRISSGSNLLIGVDQNVLKHFCASSLHPFMAELPKESVARAAKLDEQEELCKKIIVIYRYIVIKLPLSLSTWETILTTLIRITETLMPPEPPKDRLSFLCGRLALPLFQTLLVTWVKGTLSSVISIRFWDDLTRVLSRMTSWEELIIRWEKTLDLITNLLATEVFGVDIKKPSGHASASFSGYPHQPSDDGTLTHDHLRPRSSASSDTEALSIQLLSTSSRSDASVGETSSLGELNELEEDNIGKGKGDTLTNNDGNESLKYSRGSGASDYDDSSTIAADRLTESSRANSTPDSLRDSLSSPLFYHANLEKIRTASSCSSSLSIMAGGSLQGWSQDSACALWFRVFGVIGRVNDITVPAAHKFALQSVKHISDMLQQIQDALFAQHNSDDTGQPFAPVALIAPLLVEAVKLPKSYHESRLAALDMLFELTFRSRSLTRGYTTHFYRVLHDVLVSNDEDLIGCFMKNARKRMFRSSRTTEFMLLRSLVKAVKTIMKSDSADRQCQSIHMLCSILPYLDRLPDDFPCFDEDESGFHITLSTRGEIDDYVKEILHDYSSRSYKLDVRLCCMRALGIQLTRALSDPSRTSTEALNAILRAVFDVLNTCETQVINEVISLVSLLSQFSDALKKVSFSIVVSLIRRLSECLRSLIALMPTDNTEQGLDSAAVNIAMCICEWLILVPEALDHQEDPSNEHTVRVIVTEVLQSMMLMPESPEVGAETGRKEHDLRKNKRGLSEHLTPDRRFSMDAGTALTHFEETAPARRTAASFFGRASTVDPPKDRKEIQPPPKVNTKVHPLYKEGRFRLVRLAGCYVARHLSNMHRCISSENDWAVSSSLVSENGLDLADVSDNPTQIFCIYDSVVSLVPSQQHTTDETTDGRSVSSAPSVRIITRDVAGKYALEVQTLFGHHSTLQHLHLPDHRLSGSVGRKKQSLPSDLSDEPEDDLPESVESVQDLVNLHSEDFVFDILRFIDRVTPDLGLSLSHPWKHPGPPPLGISPEVEETMMRSMIQQHEAMTAYVNSSLENDEYHSARYFPPQTEAPFYNYSHCSRYFSQFGFAGIAKRQHVWLMNQTPELNRDIRLLDKQPNRETQKMAVIYIGRGQEDKLSIMTNSRGSPEYERFVLQLGWRVDLASHNGFRGGLPTSSWQFTESIYYASPILEIMFHVATKIGALSTEDHTVKMRHLGNDEVQIIWSDHHRNYDRKILPTQFGDVIICIYPCQLKALYRIQIIQRDNIPPFGPLFDGAVVGEENLSVLVRTTAVNAGRACRKIRSGTRYFFEERADYVRSLINSYAVDTTFEHFLCQVVSPAFGKQTALRKSDSQPAVKTGTVRQERGKSVTQTNDPSNVPVPVTSRYSFPLQLGVAPSATDV